MVKVHVERDWLLDGVRMLWYRRGDGQQSVWNPASGIAQIITESAATATEPIEPFVLRDADARALLAALLTYYEGSEDTRTLRRDYDAERARVDLLIRNLTKDTA